MTLDFIFLNYIHFPMPDYPNKTTIKSMAEEDRPREKLILKGRTALSESELLAILIGSGNKDETAVQLSQRILNDHENNLNELGKLSIHDLMEYKGIGEAKAISIIAALELGRRKQATEPLKRKKIAGSKDVYEIMASVVEDLSHEEFYALYLNQANKVIKTKHISRGGISGTVADVKLIMKEAVQLLAQGLIICHNHPSGNLRPSDSDIKLTRKIKEAAGYFDIRLLDHLIIAQTGYYSFADEGMI
jgi:DNA repair protein RadC